LLGGVPEAETNAGACHADVGDAPLIFEVPHAAAWAAILTVNKLGGFIPLADFEPCAIGGAEDVADQLRCRVYALAQISMFSAIVHTNGIATH
jgi:hypothetical protein